MDRLRVVLKVRGARSVQPSGEVRKLDQRLMIYRRLVKKGGEFREIVSPISPVAFKGALRQAACLMARSKSHLRDAYLSLFGSDVVDRCGIGQESGEVLNPVSTEGKLRIELVDSNLGDLREEKTVRPRVSLDRRYGTAVRGKLVFSEVIPSEIELTFELSAESPFTPAEEELLRGSLKALEGWGIGGWVSVGFGIVEEVSFEVRSP